MRPQAASRAARSTQLLTIAAIVMPLIALLVLLYDGLLLAFGPNAALRFLASGSFPWMLVFSVLLVAGFVVGYRSQALVSLSAMLVVIAAERFHGSLLPNGAINLRFDEVLGPAIAVGLLTRQWRIGSLRKVRDIVASVPAIVPLGLFLVANLIPTLFVMHDRARGLSLYIILVAGSLCYVGIVVLASQVGRVEGIITPLLIVGALEALFGLAALGLSAVLDRTDLFGVQVDPMTNGVSPYGTMYEGNFFGQFLAAIFLIATVFLIDLVLRRRMRSQPAAALALVAGLAAAGTVASLARASWLALLVAAIALVFIWPLRGALWRSQWDGQGGAGWQMYYRWLPSILTAAVLLLGGVALITLVGTGSPLGQRLTSILDFSSGSGYGRVRVLNLVISDWHNPILGMGDGSFNLTLPPLPGRPPDAPWIYSMFLAVLHDSGIVGMGLFLWFLWVVFAGLIRTVRETRRQELQALALGLIGALIVLLIAGQATTGMYLMFVWAFFGIAAAMQLLARKASGIDRVADERVAIDDLETLRLPATLPPSARAAALAIDLTQWETMAIPVATPNRKSVGARATNRVGGRTDYVESASRAHSRIESIMDHALPGVIGVVALALNFYRLDGFDVWYDEATSYGYASQPLSVMVHAFFSAGSNIALPNMTLYYFFLHFWVGLLDFLGVGPTGAALRAPSAVFAASSVVVVYFLGRRFFDRLVGIVGAGLYLCSYLQLYAAQQVRAYGLLMLLLCAAWYAFFATLDAQDGRRRTVWSIVYTGLMVLAITDHLWSAFVIAGQMVAFGAMLILPGPLHDRVRRSLFQFAISFGILSIYIAPLFLYAVHHGGESTWIPPAHLGDLIGFFAFEAGGGRFQPAAILILMLLSICANGSAWLGYLPQLTGGIEAARVTLQSAARRLLARPRPGILAVCCWLVIPTTVTFVLTQLYLNLHVFYVRYLMAVSPAFYLLVAAGVASLRWRIAQYALAVVVVAVALIHAPDYYASQAAYPDYHAPALWLEQRYEPGDGLACDQSDTCAIPMQYYLQLYRGPAHFDADSPGGWNWDIPGGIPNDSAALAAYSAKHTNVCLLISGATPESQVIQQWFSSHGLLQSVTDGAISIRCYRMVS